MPADVGGQPCIKANQHHETKIQLRLGEADNQNRPQYRIVDRPSRLLQVHKLLKHKQASFIEVNDCWNAERVQARGVIIVDRLHVFDGYNPVSFGEDPFALKFDGR